MAHQQRGPMMRGGPPGRGGPMGGRGRAPAIMPPPHGYHEYPPPQGHMGGPPPNFRGRGRPPPPMHHHSHPGYAATEGPGGYGPDESGEDGTTPESGSPEPSEISHVQGPPPGGHPGGGGGYGFHPQQRQWVDGMMAEMARMRNENSGLRDQMAGMMQGNELGGGGWDVALSDQIRDANSAIEIKNNEIYSIQIQMQEMMNAHQEQMAKLKEEVTAAEEKLKEEVKKREEEVKVLKDDLDSVTAYLSIAKAEEGVVKDDWFKEELGKFAQYLRNWTRRHCKGASNMPEMIDDIGVQTRIKHAVPEFARLTMSNSRIQVMQAVVQDIVLRRIFDRYCIGLPPAHEVSLRELEDMMTTASSGPPKYDVINRWRALTISLITNVEPIKDNADSAIVDCCSEIETVVFSMIPGHKARPGDAASKELIPLLASAVKISHHVKAQRARFDIVSPVGHIFDPEWMEDASGLEDDLDDELRGKMVGACSFPAVIKWGNEKGEDYHIRSVIYRAKVLCLLDND